VTEYLVDFTCEKDFIKKIQKISNLGAVTALFCYNGKDREIWQLDRHYYKIIADNYLHHRMPVWKSCDTFPEKVWKNIEKIIILWRQ
jgi:hypothetical protein